MTADGLLHFRDVPVLPARRTHAQGNLADGGPVWRSVLPEGPLPDSLRHLRKGAPADRVMAPCPPGLSARAEPVAQPCLWGGYAQFHFGHLIADHLGRVATAARARPDDPVLFTLPPGQGPDDVPGWFGDVTRWLGLPPERLRFVTRPLMVRDLRVAPQAEHLRGPRPDPGYLALLDSLPAARALAPVPHRILYVTRAGLIARGKGGHAGEAYLVGRLRAAGVAVLDPGAVPLPRQLALYAGAGTLVFAEGSALHGRQLLGHRPQEIAVLVRRPGLRVARHALAARCDRLEYVPAARRIAAPVRRDGTVLPAHALGFYDLPAVFAAFAARGVDLAPGWDDAAFAAARDADLRAWMAGVLRALPGRAQLAALAPVFAAEGLGAPRDWAPAATPARIGRDLGRLSRLARDALWRLRHPGWPQA